MSDKNVQTINRTLDIIELLATTREGIGVTEIGQQIGLHKSTVHRLLSTLTERGYIEKDARNSTYKLGLKFIEVSGLFLKKLELKTEAQPYLRRLAEIIGQPVHLAILDGSEAVYIEKVDGNNSIRMYSQIGRRVPVHCSAIGKTLLAGLKAKEFEETLLRLELPSFTEQTIGSRERLREEIAKVRKQGWSLDNEEHEAGIRCISAPIYDYTGRVIAAVSISGDRKIIREDRDQEIAGYVRETAKNISEKMGYIAAHQ